MRKKFFLITSFVLFLVLSLSLQKVWAKDDNSDVDNPPEKEGTYDVPGRPNLKVKVFVHNPKDVKPSPSLTTTPLLVCPSDPGSGAFVPATGWHLPPNWTYTLNTSGVPLSVGTGNLVTIANNAFNQWTGALSSGKVNVSKTLLNTTVDRAKLDNKNIIAWGRTSGTALAVTYIWYYPSTGLVAEVDTIMNQKFPWFWNAVDNKCTDQSSYDAQNVLTHELGHWMGLNDTYTFAYVNNTMYGYGAKGEIKKDTLTSGDIAGVVVIYP